MYSIYKIKIQNFSEVERDRRLGHRIVMSLFPDTLNSNNPRSSADILWKLDAPTKSIIISSSIEPTSRAVKENHIERVKEGQIISTKSDVSLTYTPVLSVPDELWSQGYRPKSGRKVCVPEEKSEDYYINLMHRNGAEVLNINNISNIYIPISDAKSRRKIRNIPAFHVESDIKIIEEDKFNTALCKGIGRLKNFGLGMINIT